MHTTSVRFMTSGDSVARYTPSTAAHQLVLEPSLAAQLAQNLRLPRRRGLDPCWSLFWSLGYLGTINSQ